MIYPFECRVPKNNKEKQEAILGDQCKEIEENNRMGKTRDHFKKIRDIKGTYRAKMGSIKDRNGMDLTEAEECALLGGKNNESFSPLLTPPVTTRSHTV